MLVANSLGKLNIVRVDYKYHTLLGFCDGCCDFLRCLAGEKFHTIAQCDDAASFERGNEELTVASVGKPRLFGVGADTLDVARVDVNLAGNKNKRGLNGVLLIKN